MDLTAEVYTLVKLLPKEELYGIAEQLRRASVSVPSNIAEGEGRGTDKEFVKFLSIARGSLLEIETQLLICNRLNLLTKEATVPAYDMIMEINKMLNSLINFRISQNKK